MTQVSGVPFEDWAKEMFQDAGFVAAVEEQEPGFLVARLRNRRGMTQAQLAELVGTLQPSIARLENGSSIPSLSFLRKIAKALNARIEIRLIPLDQATSHDEESSGSPLTDLGASKLIPVQE